MTDHSKELIPNRRAWCQQATLAGGALLWGGQVQGVDPNSGPLKLNSPQQRQVIQREGYQAAHAHEHEQGGAAAEAVARERLKDLHSQHHPRG